MNLSKMSNSLWIKIPDKLFEQAKIIFDRISTDGK